METAPDQSVDDPLTWWMVAGAYGLMLLAVAAGVCLWLLLWHEEGGWLPWISVTVMALVSLVGLASITSGVIRAARRDRARRDTR